MRIHYLLPDWLRGWITIVRTGGIGEWWRQIQCHFQGTHFLFYSHDSATKNEFCDLTPPPDRTKKRLRPSICSLPWGIPKNDFALFFEKVSLRPLASKFCRVIWIYEYFLVLLWVWQHLKQIFHRLCEFSKCQNIA